MIATPVVIGVLLYFGYALAFWRQKPGDETDAPPIHGNTRIQALWITVHLRDRPGPRGVRHRRADRSGGRGRRPGPAADLPARHAAAASDTSWAPGTNNILQVQVIGQQWAFTYRYPQFGGFETTELVLPVNTAGASSTSRRWT